MNGSSFDSIENAVLCFYQSNNALQAEAQKWLTELQNSPQIWPAIWDKLLPSGLTELQFYGATVLHAKLLKDWDEIPSDQYDALKTKLLEAIVYFKDGPQVVLNRLCISLAVLILRLTHLFWPNAVSELISLFQNASLFQNVPNVTTENLSWLLMEILQVIPEEFQTMILSKNEKIFVRGALEGDSVHVLSFLEAALISTNMDIQLQAVKCSKSWLEFGFPPESCDNLLDLLIRTVSITFRNPESFQCTINAIEAISILCTHPNITKYPKRILAFLDKILLLADILCSSPDISNCDIITNLYTLFVTMGENHLKVFLETVATGESDSFQKLLLVILRCSNAPGSYPKDEVYSIQTFNFWYLLQDELTSTNFENSPILLEAIKPYYKKLIIILMEKSVQPLDLADWSHDDKNMFRCYKQDIADTFMYCASILKHEFLEIIIQNLETAIADPHILADWRKVDSYLFALTSISESAMSENEKILHCILLVLKLPLNGMNVQVSYTVMEVLAAYAEWLYMYPQLLEEVFNLIFDKVVNPQLAAPATLALKDIIRECKTVLSLSQASNMANKMMTLLNHQHIKSNEQMRLMFSLSVVISFLPVNEIEKSLETVASEHLKRMRELVGMRKLLTTPNDQVKNTEQKITDCVNIFAQIFLGLSTQPPIPQFKLLQILLPVFEEILIHCKDQKTIDATCATLKCAITDLGDTCVDLLPNVQHIVVNTFYVNQHNALLELAKQLLLLFGSNEVHIEKMSNMLEKLCARTLASFENTTTENVSDQTSLFEHFYSFCTNVLKKNCKLLLNTSGINHIAMFRYAGFALCAQEVPTVKSASSFLCNAITISREQDALLVIVQMHGAELVYHILLSTGKIAPRSCWEYVANVLVALSKKYCDWLSRWLNEILTPEGFPSPRATPAAKKHFIKAFLREKANKRRIHDTTKEFAFLCRGILHKDYVEQTSSVL